MVKSSECASSVLEFSEKEVTLGNNSKSNSMNGKKIVLLFTVRNNFEGGICRLFSLNPISEYEAKDSFESAPLLALSPQVERRSLCNEFWRELVFPLFQKRNLV